MPLKLATMIQAGLPTISFGIVRRSCWTTSPFEEQVGNSLVVREPVGVVGAITPWNYPLHQIAAKVAPGARRRLHGRAQAQRGRAAQRLHPRRDHRRGRRCPPGVFNLVTGHGPVVGEALAAHPDVDMVSFTGSTRAGRRVSELAAADGQAGRARARRQVGRT